LALALAAAGLYSIVSYTVLQRTSEFGIRIVPGAARGHVLRIVFAWKIAGLGSGVAAGLAFVIALKRVAQSWALGNASRSENSLDGTALLTGVSGIACAIPGALRLPD